MLDIGVERDHIDSLTKASGITAISELIWNCLDADATEIKIEYKPTTLGGYEYIKIADNGHGLAFEKAQEVFSRLGGSEKKIKNQSPNGRQLHGKEGKGRYKSLALGDLVKFKSTYRSNGSIYTFTATIDRNKLSYTEISDLNQINGKGGEIGFSVEIANINTKNAAEAVSIENRREIEEKFASYWISYPDFKIFFNGNALEFASLIKHTEQTEVKVNIESLTYPFIIKIIEWNFENKRKTYLCNTKGIPFCETNLGIRSSFPISIFIQSTYIEKLHRDNLININELDEVIVGVHYDAK